MEKKNRKNVAAVYRSRFKFKQFVKFSTLKNIITVSLKAYQKTKKFRFKIVLPSKTVKTRRHGRLDLHSLSRSRYFT